MTAEIALMNKSAIALAADSAVTIQSDGKVKIYNTHKIFTLSKYYPVGIMIYGNATLTGIPWEPIIKKYRSVLGKTSFKSLKEYAEDFAHFLDNNNPLFPEAEQRKRFSFWATYYLHSRIRKRIDEQVKAIDQTGGKVSDQQLKAIVRAVIKDVSDRISGLELLPHLPGNFIEHLIKKYRDTIDEAIKIVFQSIPLGKSQLRALSLTCAGLFAKKHWISPDESGVVIGGFGEDEIFPSTTSIVMGGVLNGRLKYEMLDHNTISVQDSAKVLAFAQREMVVSFMEGIDPNFQKTFESYLSVLFNQYPDLLANSINELTSAQKTHYSKKWKSVGKGVVDEILKELNKYKLDNHILPVVHTVDVLPKDELAAMAESLVNLTSLKRKFTMDAETVGGPIDVAVISKGDGFIWIKRKHYFEAASNPQFFANYYQQFQGQEKNDGKG